MPRGRGKLQKHNGARIDGLRGGGGGTLEKNLYSYGLWQGTGPGGVWEEEGVFVQLYKPTQWGHEYGRPGRGGYLLAHAALDPKIDRATWAFRKFHMRNKAYSDMQHWG